jgi:hypothetical protein
MQNNNPIEIEGSLYYTVKQFASITNRSEQSVRLLILKGNKIRKLLCVKFADKPFIPIDELTDFPFTVSGRNQSPYHYDKQGEVINV